MWLVAFVYFTVVLRCSQITNYSYLPVSSGMLNLSLVSQTYNVYLTININGTMRRKASSESLFARNKLFIPRYIRPLLLSPSCFFIYQHISRKYCRTGFDSDCQTAAKIATKNDHYCWNLLQKSCTLNLIYAGVVFSIMGSFMGSWWFWRKH